MNVYSEWTYCELGRVASGQSNNYLDVLGTEHLKLLAEDSVIVANSGINQ